MPFLHQLLGGIVLPGSDGSPYGHHNQLQLAIKKAGFEGYASLARMASSRVGHIDQSSARQRPAGRPTSNYSMLLGVVLNGETKHRGDAGNLPLGATNRWSFMPVFRGFSTISLQIFVGFPASRPRNGRFLAPGSYKKLAEAFRETEGDVLWTLGDR